VLARLRRQDGQIIPALMVLMLALLAVGVMFFQVGRAAIFSTEAQTAADAAALAAVNDVRDQLLEQLATTGTTDLARVNPLRVRAAAESYAQRNGARIVRFDRRGVDVKVWVATNAKLGRGAERLDQEDTRGEEHARARLELISLPGGAGNIGQMITSGVSSIKDSEWKALEEDISSPPTCGTGASSNDLVALGKLLQKHGFTVAENADFGDDPQPGDHSSTGYHYLCRHSGALDVNVYGTPEEPAIDGIVEDVQALGFRTIWRAPDHFDHIHIDVANSGPIGAGFGAGGALGPLEETGMSVKLIDWETSYLPFFGLGGPGGSGFYSGPPDPDVARTICEVLDRYHAPPKVRLAAFEAAIVESGVHNLNYGDRDSIGVYQQRPSMIVWGTPAQIMNPDHAAMKFITNAIRLNGGQSPGQLAQDVQGSAFPDRYDAVSQQAYALMTKYCGGS
jgi:putative Flp pilus-assembly TadE/G-like protein